MPLAIAGLALLALVARPVAAPARLQSAAASGVVTIDGMADQWPVLQPLEDTRLSIGVQNDGRNLYLMIATSDQGRRQQLMVAGLVIWLDAKGGKKRSFGVRLPGMLLAGGPTGPRGQGGPPEGRAWRPDLSAGEGLPPLTHFEIVGPGDDDRRRVELSATRSIQIARQQVEGTLTLELQIPLAGNDGAPYAIGAAPASVIGLGLETPKLERPEGPPADGPGGGRRPGGMGGGGGRGGGGQRGGGGGGGGRGGMGSGRGPGGARMEQADPLKLWTTVLLAERR